MSKEGREKERGGEVVEEEEREETFLWEHKEREEVVLEENKRTEGGVETRLLASRIPIILLETTEKEDILFLKYLLVCLFVEKKVLQSPSFLVPFSPFSHFNLSTDKSKTIIIFGRQKTSKFTSFGLFSGEKFKKKRLKDWF